MRFYRAFGLFFVIFIIFLLSSCIEEDRPVSSKILHRVDIARVEHGVLSIKPDIKDNKSVEDGSMLTLEAKADKGYVLDSVYYAVKGDWGPLYHESLSGSLSFFVKEDVVVGAHFIKEEEITGIELIDDVVYARPGVKALKYDVFKPHKAKNLPLVIIVHGGGWRINDEHVMRGMAREIAKTGRYVAVSIDYRWLGTLDGDKEPNRIWELIEDVYGAIAHIREHSADYGADPDRIALTGDSAGGHLSAAAALLTDRLGSKGFVSPYYQFLPTYLPEGKTAEELGEELKKAIKVVAPSYGIYGGSMLQRATEAEPAILSYISPQDNIPDASLRSIPHYLIWGTADPVIPRSMMTGYAEALKAKGQTVKFVELAGAGHAFFDWKPDEGTIKTFKKYGVPYIKDMLEFFDGYM